MSVHSFNYNSEYDPPAPVVDITVRKTGQTDKGVSLSALIDSGADATMLPFMILQTVIGRDVLNQLVITLNGPAEITEIMK